MSEKEISEQIIADGRPDISLDSELDNDQKQPHTLSGPMKLIIGIFLLLIIVLWAIPYYSIKEDPSPKRIPDIYEVYVSAVGNYSDAAIGYVNNTIGNDYLAKIDYTSSAVVGAAGRISSIACDYSENYRACQSKAVYYFVRDKFSYVQDPLAFEYVKGPIESLETGAGDCDDASVLVASLLGAIGIRTRLVFVPGHVYIEAYLQEASSKYKAYRGQNWVALDATCKNCNYGEIPFQNLQKERRYIEVN